MCRASLLETVTEKSATAVLLAPPRRRRTMKYICLGYIEPGKLEGMTEDERNANLGEFHVWLEICLRYLHPHNMREAVACINNARDNKAVSVWNERRKRMEGRLHVENVC